MPNGFKVPIVEQDRLDLVVASVGGVVNVGLERSGNIIILRLYTASVTNGLLSVSIPSDWCPKEERVNPVTIYRTTSPTHAIGYATVSTGGVVTIIEPSNGSYIMPTAKVYGEVVWTI